MTGNVRKKTTFRKRIPQACEGQPPRAPGNPDDHSPGGVQHAADKASQVCVVKTDKRSSGNSLKHHMWNPVELKRRVQQVSDTCNTDDRRLEES